MPSVIVVGLPGAFLSSVGLFIDAFARLGEAYDANPSLKFYSRRHTEIRLVSLDGRPVHLAGDRQMEADMTYAQARDISFVYLPSFQVAHVNDIDGSIHAPGMPAFHDWLTTLHSKGVALGACGAGVFHLAAAGLLDDEAAAIHPRMDFTLRTTFPKVRVATEPVVATGKGLFTCATDADGPALALRVLEQVFSPFVRRGLMHREPLDADQSTNGSALDPLVAMAKFWLYDNFAQNIRIADVAARFRVSHQTLIRRFREAGEGTPLACLQRKRLEAASSMLILTRRSVNEIGQLVGYADVASFRHKFQAMFGISPSSYRQRERANRTFRAHAETSISPTNHPET